jgi:OmcA/MtrC family decaheme c-type cytochrome
MTGLSARATRGLLGVVMTGALGLVLAALPVEAGAQDETCVGDCNESGMVEVTDIVKMVNIVLESVPVTECPAGECNGAGNGISVSCIVTAVNNSFSECSGTTSPTPTATLPIGTETSTPTGTLPLGDTPTPTPTRTATTGRSPTPQTAGPGLSSTILSVTISNDGQVVTTFTLTDAQGIPLTPVLSSTQNPNQARTRFAIAHIENYGGGGDLNTEFSKYVNDVNATRPAFDSGGAAPIAVDAAAGVYQYTFKTMLPQAVNSALTYTVGMQIDRTFEGQQLGVDPVYHFVPGGGTVQMLQDVTTEQCNSCHAPLLAHGNRREVPLCILCHTEDAVDAVGTTIDFRNMIHKIHAGKELPSIVNGPPGSTYQICGSRGCDVFAEKDDDGNITGVGFPRTLEDCLKCHSEGPTASYYMDRPAAAACATCHDDVNPSQSDTAAGPPGTNHFQERGFPDGDCTFCHEPDSGKEFDISVVGAHVIPERSSQLAGLNVDIMGLTNHGAGQMPTISFKVTDNAGTPLLDLSGLNRLAFNLNGPTTDYANAPLTPVAAGGGATGMLTGPDGSGVFQYTPATGIPANAIGTWALGVEARRSVQLATVDPIEPKTVNEAAVNTVVTFTVDDSTAVMRRIVVEDENCQACHGEFSKDFSIHGNLRNQTQYCVMCHNPNNSDAGRRRNDPAAVARGDQTTSIDFKVMIHKIHTGEDLEQKPYIIYGFGAAPLNYSINDFAEVRFPGDRRNCQTCHAPGTYLIPPYPGTALGTLVAHLDPATGNEVVDGRLGPIRSVCTSCHDGEDAAAHAETMTTSDGAEACPVCHEEGHAFAVSELHAGRN